MLAEVDPEPRELGSLEGRLGWQDRAWDSGSGACCLVANPAGGFARHYRCSKVPPQSWEGGKANTSPAPVEGGNGLVPRRLIGQRVKASGRKLGKASWLLWPRPAKSCRLLVRRPPLGSPARPSPLQPLCPLCSPPVRYYSPPATWPLLSSTGQPPFDCLLPWLREGQSYGKAVSRCSPLSSSLIFLSCLLSFTFSSSFIL